jgi:hypothetical protein
MLGQPKPLKYLWSGRSYWLALLIGLVAIRYAVPPATLMGSGGLFLNPPGDLPLNLVGHLAFQAPGWHWPLLRTPELAWPVGESIAMTDSNPALSILAKLIVSTGGYVINLFGLWLCLCIGMQPVAAVYAIRGLQSGDRAGSFIHKDLANVAAGILTLLLPAYLFRVIHINLFANFLLLIAIGYAGRNCARDRAPRLLALTAFLSLAVLVHPYLFIFCCLTMAAPAVQMVIRHIPGAREALRTWGLAALLPVFGFMCLSFSSGGGGPGFGLYSTNLLAPVWPQMSGLFGAKLPIIDATGYQREGFNYLGAGNILLLIGAAACLVQAGRPYLYSVWRHFAGLIVVLFCVAILALTPRLTFGSMTLLPIDVPVIDKLFAPVRASGRAIWSVDYAIILAALCLLAERLRPCLFVPFIIAVVLLQWNDTSPLRTFAKDYLAGEGQSAQLLDLPKDTTLFRVVPLCASDDFAADRYRLQAFRAGAHLAEVRLAHPPLSEACASALSYGLNTPVAPGETRLFLPSIMANVRQGHLGTSTICKTQFAGLMCHNPRPI